MGEWGSGGSWCEGYAIMFVLDKQELIYYLVRIYDLFIYFRNRNRNRDRNRLIERR